MTSGFLSGEEAKRGITGNQLIDLEILIQLNPDDLPSVCSANKYLNELCNGKTQNYVYKERVTRYMPDHVHLVENNNWKILHDALVDLYNHDEWSEILADEYVDRSSGTDHNNFMALKILADAKIFPSEIPETIERALLNNNMKMVQWLHDLEYPIDKGAVFEVVSSENNLDSTTKISQLEWLEETGVVIDDFDANSAAAGNNIKILKWMAKRNIYPNRTGIVNAADVGSIEALEWLDEQEKLLNLPDVTGVEGEAEDDDEPEEGEDIGYTHYLSDAALRAAIHGYLNVVKFFGDRGIFPNKNSYRFGNIVGNGHLNVLKYLEPKIGLPLSAQLTASLNRAIINNYFDVADWLISKGVFPSREAAKEAVIQNTFAKSNIPALEYLANLPLAILPSRIDATKALAGGRLEILDWLANSLNKNGNKRTIYPIKEDIKDLRLIEILHPEVLEWAKVNVPGW